MSTTVFHSLLRRCVPRGLRNSLRNPSTTIRRAWRKLRFASGQVGAVEPRADWTVRCHPLCVEAFKQFRVDLEQCAELDSFVTHCTPGMRLLDLGAHWGFLTLATLHFGGASARSVAVEPSEAAEKLLKVNLELNGCAERATVLNKAVGERLGTVEMLTTGAGGNDYFVIPTEKRSDTRAVPQTTIDQICDDLDYQPSHIKIDVEGYEEEVLLGAGKFLTASQPTIFLELHGNLIQDRGRQPEAPLQILRGYGYQRFELDGQPVEDADLAARNHVARLVCSTTQATVTAS